MNHLSLISELAEVARPRLEHAPEEKRAEELARAIVAVAEDTTGGYAPADAGRLFVLDIVRSAVAQRVKSYGLKVRGPRELEIELALVYPHARKRSRGS